MDIKLPATCLLYFNWESSISIPQTHTRAERVNALQRKGGNETKELQINSCSTLDKSARVANVCTHSTFSKHVQKPTRTHAHVCEKPTSCITGELARARLLDARRHAQHGRYVHGGTLSSEHIHAKRNFLMRKVFRFGT